MEGLGRERFGWKKRCLNFSVYACGSPGRNGPVSRRCAAHARYWWITARSARVTTWPSKPRENRCSPSRAWLTVNNWIRYRKHSSAILARSAVIARRDRSLNGSAATFAGAAPTAPSLNPFLKRPKNINSARVSCGCLLKITYICFVGLDWLAYGRGQKFEVGDQRIRKLNCALLLPRSAILGIAAASRQPFY